jgi:hypothetical protein
MASVGTVGKGILNKITSPLSKVPKIEAIGFTAMVGIETISNMSQGKGFGESLVKGAAVGVLQNVVGFGPLFAYSMAEAAPALVGAAMTWNDKLNAQHRAMRDPNYLNFNYTDTEQALTMRQSAVQAIQGSKLNARSALGGEARLMHRGVPTRWAV